MCIRDIGAMSADGINGNAKAKVLKEKRRGLSKKLRDLKTELEEERE